MSFLYCIYTFYFLFHCQLQWRASSFHFSEMKCSHLVLIILKSTPHDTHFVPTAAVVDTTTLKHLAQSHYTTNTLITTTTHSASVSSPCIVCSSKVESLCHKFSSTELLFCTLPKTSNVLVSLTKVLTLSHWLVIYCAIDLALLSSMDASWGCQWVRLQYFL